MSKFNKPFYWQNYYSTVGMGCQVILFSSRCSLVFGENVVII